MKVLLHPKAATVLQKLDVGVAIKIKKKLKKLENNPRLGKPLKYSDFRSLRIGNYRAIYEVYWKKKQVIVLFIGHRRRVYEDFSKMF